MEETTPSVLLYYNGKKLYFYMEETTPSVLLYYNGRNNSKCTLIL